MPNLHIHQSLQNTHEYMNTHVHITHITNIFRIDEMKEINLYNGEQNLNSCMECTSCKLSIKCSHYAAQLEKMPF